MEDLQVYSDKQILSIKSHKGVYHVALTEDVATCLNSMASKRNFFIVDKNILRLYPKVKHIVLSAGQYIEIDALEINKDLTVIPSYIQKLVDLGVKRDSVLVAIGGGITQDITCFIAATLFRGMQWIFFPTTLLAQADSCIGSKSSINVNGIKNLVGTFTPPSKIFIDVGFLNSLDEKDIISGIGEMIKVHGIAGIDKLSEFSNDFDEIRSNKKVLADYLVKSLEIKKIIIEQDEFDTGIRNIMNYGHTFGHAVESAAKYTIPHGIAVVIGQAMACEFSFQKKMISEKVYHMAISLLEKNYGKSKDEIIDFSIFCNVIKKDKKNMANDIALILPIDNDFTIRKVPTPADDSFFSFCKKFFLDNGFNIYEK